MPVQGKTDAHPVVLYDGECGLCSRVVQDVLRVDRQGLFHFAPLQGSYAEAALTRHGLDPAQLDTVCVLIPEARDGTAPERLLVRSRAVLYLWRRLGGMRALAATLAGILPTLSLDSAYNFIAKHRHQILPQGEAQCWLPKPEYADRFIED